MKFDLKSSTLKALKFLWNFPRNFLVLLISIYQKTLSPDHGPLKKLYPLGYCRFSPTCSEYGKAVIKKHGSIIGGAKAFYRVVRCNPFNEGGYDPPK
ncbi:MAG: membrane protein insertion efficiency factor YidD [Candidatus Gracilibacteria bacterium]|jgi:putative membrane protein insertion efficiency factor|nr:membrane protein insertion efficiency factor YidD [Candidatus Gracilibacteria bacterium]